VVPTWRRDVAQASTPGRARSASHHPVFELVPGWVAWRNRRRTANESRFGAKNRSGRAQRALVGIELVVLLPRRRNRPAARSVFPFPPGGPPARQRGTFCHAPQFVRAPQDQGRPPTSAGPRAVSAMKALHPVRTSETMARQRTQSVTTPPRPLVTAGPFDCMDIPSNAKARCLTITIAEKCRRSREFGREIAQEARMRPLGTGPGMTRMRSRFGEQRFIHRPRPMLGPAPSAAVP